MNEILEFMSQDHDRLDEIFNSFRKIKGQDVDKAKELFNELNNGLRRHIDWEENILFPSFEEQTGMKNIGPTAVMRLEHYEIKEFLDKIHRGLQEKNDSIEQIEDAFIRVLSSHNQKEEKILYPRIDRSLNEKDRKAMIDKMNMTLK
ncbi:MAG TPA: hemerythrin domain-containing protein [Nitrospiria bacterium]|nr:hemerythrin domain-containing protein [Nitrospiria bacterium]